MSPDTDTVRRPFPILPGIGGLLRGRVRPLAGTARGLVHLIVWTILIQTTLFIDTVHTWPSPWAGRRL